MAGTSPAKLYNALGVVELTTTFCLYQPSPVGEVESIVFTSANAGLYTIIIDGWTLSLTTTAEKLVEVIPFNRPVRSVQLTAMATSGKVHLLLRRKSSG